MSEELVLLHRSCHLHGSVKATGSDRLLEWLQVYSTSFPTSVMSCRKFHAISSALHLSGPKAYNYVFSSLQTVFQRKHPHHLAKEPSTSDPGQGALHPPCKQAKLEFGQRTAQSTINKLILDFVIDDVQLFSLVE